MQAQHKEQLDERDRQGHPPPPNPLQAPGVQMMPPSAYAGGPPPQGGGYPPQVCSSPLRHRVVGKYPIAWSVESKF
jgi:hypothetical protein